MRDPEYDRFGPWVIEISDEDPPPPLFLPYLTRTDPPLLSVKIPRKIERRRAHPGMDLYDYMACLYEDEMLILQRIDHGVRSMSLPYSDVRFVRATEELLRGNVHVSLANGSFDLPFNTVWEEPMRRLVDLIRERYAPGPRDVTSGTELDIPRGGLSFYFDRLLTTERQSGSGMRLLAAQPETTITPHESDRLRRIFFRVVDKRLTETMHLSDGRELKIIGRGQTYAYRWQTVYGTEVCYMPVTSLTDVVWQEDAQNGTISLVLGAGSGQCTFAFAQDNPTVGAYRASLAALPLASTDR